ncbi:MAG: hypothetical protein RR292_07995 [Christensenellaceae bacterium]
MADIEYGLTSDGKLLSMVPGSKEFIFEFKNGVWTSFENADALGIWWRVSPVTDEKVLSITSGAIPE